MYMMKLHVNIHGETLCMFQKLISSGFSHELIHYIMKSEATSNVIVAKCCCISGCFAFSFVHSNFALKCMHVYVNTIVSFFLLLQNFHILLSTTKNNFHTNNFLIVKLHVLQEQNWI